MSVYWEEDEPPAWFAGTVRAFNRVTQRHTVVYDDGDQRDEALQPGLQGEATCTWKALLPTGPPLADAVPVPAPPMLTPMPERRRRFRMNGDAAGEEIFAVETLLAVRTAPSGVREYLVRWM